MYSSSHICFRGLSEKTSPFGRKEATEEEIRAAARMVRAEEFILAQKDGYDTQVGEGGIRLSTGQKQLISFARVILADPRIFVLDEATSSIDTETEQLIQQAITTVLKNRTSFIVAHRLSTIRNSDLILVIGNGGIIESGTHETTFGAKGRLLQSLHTPIILVFSNKKRFSVVKRRIFFYYSHLILCPNNCFSIQEYHFYSRVCKKRISFCQYNIRIFAHFQRTNLILYTQMFCRINGNCP